MNLQLISDRYGYHFLDVPLFPHLDGFFDGNLVEGVHRHFEAFEFNACFLGVDSHLDGVVEDSLDSN